MCMGSPSIPAAAPAPAPTPPPPTAVDPAVLAARQNAAANARNAYGMGAAEASGPSLDSDTTNQKKTLLGQ